MMIYHTHSVCAAILCVIPGLLSGIACADDQYKIIKKEEQAFVEICRSGDCKKVILPVQEIPSSYNLLNLVGQSAKIIFAEPLRGGMDVNFCGNIYALAEDDSIKKLKIAESELFCNVTVHRAYIVSSYRSAASWFDDVYSYKAGYLTKELQDKNGSSRTIYDKNGKVIDEFVLSGEDKNWWKRGKVSGRVIHDKAQLYNSPNTDDVSKMYLVKGDVFLLKKEQVSDNGDTWFYLVEYHTNGNRKILKWIETELVEKIDIK